MNSAFTSPQHELSRRTFMRGAAAASTALMLTKFSTHAFAMVPQDEFMTWSATQVAALIREKKLSNVRNHGKDDNVLLASPRLLTIETAMEWIDNDELVEVTPEAVRVRKKVLACNRRERREDAIERAQSQE